MQASEVINKNCGLEMILAEEKERFDSANELSVLYVLIFYARNSFFYIDTQQWRVYCYPYLLIHIIKGFARNRFDFFRRNQMQNVVFRVSI